MSSVRGFGGRGYREFVAGWLAGWLASSLTAYPGVCIRLSAKKPVIRPSVVAEVGAD